MEIKLITIFEIILYLQSEYWMLSSSVVVSSSFAIYREVNNPGGN